MAFSLARFLIGRPIANRDAEQEKMGVLTALPSMGLDSLASAAYGPEAALAVLAFDSALDLSRAGHYNLITEHLMKIIRSIVRRTVVLHRSAKLGGGLAAEEMYDRAVINLCYRQNYPSVFRSNPRMPDRLPGGRCSAAGGNMSEVERLLIKGGQVYDHDGNIHKPAVADIRVEGTEITAIGSNLGDSTPGATRVIDASGRLIIPGLINAHYHSHDTLCRGMFEELPLETWLLYTLPMGANRSKEEVRARTLVGAVESLRAGITTVQDMLGLVPLNEEYVDVVLSAYRDIGIRVVFSPMVSDIPAVGMMRFKDDLPQDVQEMLGTSALPAREQLDFLDSQYKRNPAAGTLHWAVAPFAPQRCTPKMLEGCAELAHNHNLCVYTHVYETRGQVLIARDQFGQHGGSLINYLDSTGLLGPRLNIVHSVWISRPEMDRMAAANAGIVLNHLSNLKLKSGIAPVCDLRESGVRLGLGCDNCSGSDVQSVFQAMKLFCLFSAVSEPEPGPSLAHQALRHATLGNARTAGLDGRLGALRPGYKADMVLIDLNDAGYLPYNSAARQLVYTEAGRGIETVIVDGRPLIEKRKLLSIDEDALRREVTDLMRHFVDDYERVVESRKRALPFMLEAHRKVWNSEIDVANRFIARTR